MTCIRRYWDVCWESRVLLLVALFLPLNVAQNASAQTQANRTSAAQPPTLTAAQRERLTERDRLWDETMKLDSNGKLADALVAAESVLAIERSVLGEKSDDAIDSMELIASIHERRENWPEAIAMRRDVLKLQVGVLGESHWKVTDARLAVQDVERRAAMKGENRRQLAEANRLEDEDMSRFYAAGRYSDAIEPAQRL